ncbi:MAG TPA: radical SAM protein [Nitrospirota bacterium]
MNYYKQFKNYTMTQVVDAMVGMLGNSSDENLIRLTYLAEKMAKKDYYISTIRMIRGLFEQGHPSLQVAKKIIRETHPNVRKKLVNAFIINQALLGTNKRKAFQDEGGGFYPPGFFVISPSMKCNLNCFGCYAGSYKKTAELTFGEVDSVLSQMKEMGVHFCVVSGGEPFFREDLLDIYAKHSDTAFLVFTHGGLLDEKMVARVAELGNVLPCISIEGTEEETDARRGPGHYQKVMKAMDMLKSAGVLFGFSCTATSRNIDAITSPEYIDLMVEKGCTLGWFFSYIPIGREPKVELMPSPEQRDRLREFVWNTRNEKPILLADFWNDGHLVNGCLAGGRRYFHVNANGDVEPCVFCHFAVDNIRQSTIKQALMSPLFRSIREKVKSNPNPLRPCIIIDNPEVLREVVLESGARFTHEGAEKVLTDLAPHLDAYSDCYAKFGDSAWKKVQAEREAKAEMENAGASR